MIGEYEIRAINNAGTVFWREIYEGDERSAIAKGADIAASYSDASHKATTEVSLCRTGKTVAFFEPGWC
jgi:hypothetical protein